MKATSLHSIGHGNKDLEDLIAELKAFSITYLVDIRSVPFSKHNPQFNQNSLKFTLAEKGIQYVHFGKSLGAFPEDDSCYDQAGNAVYDRIKEKDFFKKGVARLLKADEKNIRLAIMSSRANPAQCHRTTVIGQVLLQKGLSLNHIVSSEKTKSQEQVIMEVTKGKGTVDLFGNKPEFKAKKNF